MVTGDGKQSREWNKQKERMNRKKDAEEAFEDEDKARYLSATPFIDSETT